MCVTSFLAQLRSVEALNFVSPPVTDGLRLCVTGFLTRLPLQPWEMNTSDSRRRRWKRSDTSVSTRQPPLTAQRPAACTAWWASAREERSDQSQLAARGWRWKRGGGAGKLELSTAREIGIVTGTKIRHTGCRAGILVAWHALSALRSLAALSVANPIKFLLRRFFCPTVLHLHFLSTAVMRGGSRASKDAFVSKKKKKKKGKEKEKPCSHGKNCQVRKLFFASAAQNTHDLSCIHTHNKKVGKKEEK